MNAQGGAAMEREMAFTTGKQKSQKSGGFNKGEVQFQESGEIEMDPFAPLDGQVNTLISHSTEQMNYLMQNGGSMDNQIDGQMLSPDNGKGYKCQIEDCSKQFPDQSSYRKHQMTHGERMFICPVDGCGKKFLDNSKLKRH